MKCDSILWFGSGHQSKMYCDQKEDHEIHSSSSYAYKWGISRIFWKGLEAHTGFFDEIPNNDKIWGK